MNDKEDVLVELLDLNDDQKMILLEVLGFGIDEKGIVINSSTGKPEKCPYTNKEVSFKDASLLPGSTIIINTNAVTLAQYLADHPKFRFKQ